MTKFTSLSLLTAILISGCATTPAYVPTVYKTVEVKVPVAVAPTVPDDLKAFPQLSPVTAVSLPKELETCRSKTCKDFAEQIGNIQMNYTSLLMYSIRTNAYLNDIEKARP